MKCEICGTEMKPLLTGNYCPNEENHDKSSCRMRSYLVVGKEITLCDSIHGTIDWTFHSGGTVLTEISISTLTTKDRMLYDFWMEMEEYKDNSIICFKADENDNVVIFIPESAIKDGMDKKLIKPMTEESIKTSLH